MLNLGKQIITRTIAQRDARDLERGYAWAAGELLSERETPESIVSDLCYGSESHPFDRGALRACSDWEKLQLHQK